VNKLTERNLEPYEEQQQNTRERTRASKIYHEAKDGYTYPTHEPQFEKILDAYRIGLREDPYTKQLLEKLAKLFLRGYDKDGAQSTANDSSWRGKRRRKSLPAARAAVKKVADRCKNPEHREILIAAATRYCSYEERKSEGMKGGQ
jgi:hypothetical protein